MPTDVIMPALEMAQETGKVIRWLKAPGTTVTKGEPIVEIETDKITVEIEAPASGVLRDVTANEGDVVPVGHTIAVIGDAGSPAGVTTAPAAPSPRAASAPAPSPERVKASPLARKIAEQHGVDLAHVRTSSGKVEKADVLAHVSSRGNGRLVAASPKARRLAAERGVDVATLRGSGPDGAVLAADVSVAPRGAPSPAGGGDPVGGGW